MTRELCIAVSQGSSDEVQYFLEQGGNPNANIVSRIQEISRSLIKQSENSGQEAHFTAFHLCIFKCFLVGKVDHFRKLKLLIKHNADLLTPINGIDIEEQLTIETKTPMEFLMLIGHFYSRPTSTSNVSEVLIEALRKQDAARPALPMTQVPQAVLDTWKKLLFSEHSSDVVFVCPDGTEIYAHKNILAAASPYFHTYFRGTWGQKDKHKDGKWHTEI